MYNWLSTTYAGDNRAKIKRYITSCNVIFGRKIPALNITAGNVAGGRLRIFNSYQEALNQEPVSGAQEIIDTYTNTVLPVILEKETIAQLMEMQQDPNIYLGTVGLSLKVKYKGAIKYFRYNPNYMRMVVQTTADEKVYNNMLKAAQYEEFVQSFTILARRNGKALAELALNKNLTATQQSQIKAEISKHKFAINSFELTLAPGFFMDKRGLKADAIGIVFVIPVIVWVVAIIATGLAVISYQWANAFEQVKKHKATLEDRYRAIMSISDAVSRNKALQEAASTDNKNLETAANADAENATSTGWLGQVKQILFVGLVAYGIKEFLPLFTKKK